MKPRRCSIRVTAGVMRLRLFLSGERPDPVKDAVHADHADHAEDAPNQDAADPAINHSPSVHLILSSKAASQPLRIRLSFTVVSAM